MSARPAWRVLQVTVAAFVVVACSTTPGPTVIPVVPTPAATSIAQATFVPDATFASPPTPDPSVDQNALPPTTTVGWWGDPDFYDGCRIVGHYRIGYRVAQIGDCTGLRTAPELTLDVGQDFDLHMSVPADGAQPALPLPEAVDPLIVQGWLAFDDATWTYRALSPGTTELVSAAPCDTGTTETAATTAACPILIITVRDISTKCVQLSADVCRAVAAAAVRADWVINPGQRIVGWVAQPDHFIGGADCGDGVAKVTFTVADPAGEVMIQIGDLRRTEADPPRYVVCSY